MTKTCGRQPEAESGLPRRVPDNRSRRQTAAVEAWLRTKPREQAEMALAIRDMVLTIVPDAQERILRKGLGYHDPKRGGPVKGSLCMIEFHPGDLRLAFVHGAFLKDPLGLLQGDRRAKRFVKLFTYHTVPWPALESLIRQAAGLDTSQLVLSDLERG